MGLKPKCVLELKEDSLSSQGFIFPCCLLDNPEAHKEKYIKDFLDPKLNIRNVNDLSEIYESETFKGFYKMLIENPEDAPPTCKHHCGQEHERKKLVYEESELIEIRPVR